MSKPGASRRWAETEAAATLRAAKGSPQKARLVLDAIRGKTVEQAVADLTFSRKRLAQDVLKLVQSATANAENNHDLNADRLFVKTAFADKSLVMKRFRARARGRASKILKPRCHMTVVVAEKAKEQPKPKPNAKESS